MSGSEAARFVIPAAGGVVWKEGRVAVVRRIRYADTSLPKGKLAPGESFEAAAVREVEEETGTVPRITGFLRCVDYPVGDRRKLVVFFAMEAVREGTPDAADEVAETLWLDPADAMTELEYPLEREVLLAAVGARAVGG